MKRARRFDPVSFINEGLDEQFAEEEEFQVEMLAEAEFYGWEEDDWDWYHDWQYDDYEDWGVALFSDEAFLEDQAQALGISWPDEEEFDRQLGKD